MREITFGGTDQQKEAAGVGRHSVPGEKATDELVDSHYVHMLQSFLHSQLFVGVLALHSNG